MSDRSGAAIESSDSLRRFSYAGFNVGLSLLRSQNQQKLRRVSLNTTAVCEDKVSAQTSGVTRVTPVSETSVANSANSVHSVQSKMLPNSYERVVDHIVIGPSMRPSVRCVSSLDTSRVNRQLNRKCEPHDTFTCSQQSILSAMDRFVKSVNNMDSTVLVPSRLRDMEIASSHVPLSRIPPSLANTDLHSFYLMLNDVKKELLWGPAMSGGGIGATLVPMSGRSSPRELKHVRQPSDDSLGSLESTTSTSTASSSSDQDTDSEADSMITDRDSIDEQTSHLAQAFRLHLQGLHTILHQLADSADYLSSRYQEEVDASSL